MLDAEELQLQMRRTSVGKKGVVGGLLFVNMSLVVWYRLTQPGLHDGGSINITMLYRESGPHGLIKPSVPHLRDGDLGRRGGAICNRKTSKVMLRKSLWGTLELAMSAGGHFGGEGGPLSQN